eukprot:3433928-Pyramimonas_sp.AAC.1
MLLLQLAQQDELVGHHHVGEAEKRWQLLVLRQPGGGPRSALFCDAAGRDHGRSLVLEWGRVGGPPPPP